MYETRQTLPDNVNEVLSVTNKIVLVFNRGLSSQLLLECIHHEIRQL